MKTAPVPCMAHQGISECPTPVRHVDTWITLHEIVDRLDLRPFRLTFDNQITLAGITRYLEAPVNGFEIETTIPGSLRREDAAKLYEMAFYTQGDVLEL